jgi:tetratricopeptide (TPR) repeat protein
MQSITDKFDLALQHHRAGNLHQAEMLYRQVLQAEPQNVNALHLLGLIAYQAGRSDLAIGYIQESLRLYPTFPAAHYNLANALRDQRRLDEAISHYQEAIRLQPDHAHSYNNLGHILKQQGKLDAAIASLRQALRLDPDLAEAYNTLGNALREQRKLDEAIAAFRQALRCRPNYFEVYNNLGVALQDQGKHAEAVASFRHALTLNPDFAAAYNNLGNALRDQDQFGEAISAYQQALRLKPDFAEVFNNLGNVLRDQGRLDEALVNYEKVLQLRPQFADAHFNLALTLQDQGKFDLALLRCQQALQLRPAFPEAYNTLGSIFKNQDKLDEAVAAYREALRLNPVYIEAFNNIGVVLQDQGKHDEALTCLRQSVALRPDYADAHFNLSLQLLVRGQYAEGWEEYAWRWRSKAFLNSSASGRPALPEPVWDGSPLHGRSILLLAEQGLGDTIMFVRYAPLLKQRGAGKVLLACPPELKGLSSSCKGIDQIVTETPFPQYDVGSFLVSLPRLLGTSSTEHIPADVPYLGSDPQRIERWEARLSSLAPRPVRRVGIVWQGNPSHKQDRWRSVRLEQFAPLAAHPGVRLISLQKGVGREQLEKNPQLAADLGPELVDLADTAAVIHGLDLVITVDTALAHLAGALAAPVWVAVAMVPDWRWLLNREDSPWYPSMRLFRQARQGQWDEVFDRMRIALSDFSSRTSAATTGE